MVSRPHPLRHVLSRSAPYVALCLLVLVVAGLVLSGRYFQSETAAIYDQRGAIGGNIERIRYYDEALTGSARLAAATGDRKYERRYLRLAPQLDRLIKATVTLVGTREASAQIGQTDAANRALVAMETRSFSLVRRGRRAEAAALLSSAAYQQQKQLYANGAAAAFRSFLATSDGRARDVDRYRLLALVLGTCSGIVVLLIGGLYVRHARERERISAENERRKEQEERRRAEELDYHETQREFNETMQITRGEQEAHELLKRHLERSVAGSGVVVLNRNNSQVRLQPMTRLPDDSPLAGKLHRATPDSCLAVRLAKPHDRDGLGEALLVCELCGSTGSPSTCVPSLVGGEVIGSVLVQHPAPLDSAERRRVAESVSQAAPVLANLRNLALAEARALTDALTGLPNKRAIEDSFKRMVAHAERANRPLAAVLFDLDHFKQVNDAYGHEKGDEVLAAVAAAVGGTLRASDFAGRFGGEEFVLLLPDTDSESALVAAEKVRQAIEAIVVPGVAGPITASFGIAAMPEDAPDAPLLLRVADRALYLAKAGGRNRVERIPGEALEASVP